jgi:hypothetical protein
MSVIHDASGRGISADNPLNVKTASSDVIQPTDQQARLTVTQQAQAGVLIAPSTSNVQASWTPVPDGMTEFMTNMVADAGVSGTSVNVNWSEDGSATSGKQYGTIQGGAGTQKTSIQWYPVAGAFYKLEIYNGDTAAHTCSANIKFRP